jgi:hypothetical protein
MTQSIGPKGHIDFYSNEVGPTRKVSAHTFYARGDTGFCAVPGLRAGEPPFAVIDLAKGHVCTSSFGGTVTGGISQIDTGGLGGDGQFATSHVMLALVTDTGAVGL